MDIITYRKTPEYSKTQNYEKRERGRERGERKSEKRRRADYEKRGKKVLHLFHLPHISVRQIKLNHFRT